MILHCHSFGSLSWLRPGNDSSDTYRFTRHAALFNTTGFVTGSRERRLWYVPGVVRMNVGVLFGAQGMAHFEPGTYASSGLERRGEWNRVKLDRKMPERAKAALILICVTSQEIGRIDLLTRWHGLDTNVVAGSALRAEQETLLLARPGARVTSERGLWEITWNGLRRI